MRKGLTFLSVFVKKHSSYKNTKHNNTYEWMYTDLQSYINKYGLSTENSQVKIVLGF